MEVNEVKRTHGQNVINGWKKSWSVRLSSRAEGALVERFEKHVADHRATIAELTRERDELRGRVITEDVHGKMTTLVGLLEMWRDAKIRPDYLVALLEEANEFLRVNDPFKTTEAPL